MFNVQKTRRRHHQCSRGGTFLVWTEERKRDWCSWTNSLRVNGERKRNEWRRTSFSLPLFLSRETEREREKEEGEGKKETNVRCKLQRCFHSHLAECYSHNRKARHGRWTNFLEISMHLHGQPTWVNPTFSLSRFDHRPRKEEQMKIISIYLLAKVCIAVGGSGQVIMITGDWRIHGRFIRLRSRSKERKKVVVVVFFKWTFLTDWLACLCSCSI